ncbi:hypothetical protein ABT294_42305 [Nonomuraea sp. NPDC000554]|uniref:hypothetical protein n=1 Tax=Nonomuraea sp. NPDC000554 TaxID=3154259 RepID=UPI00332F0D94
MRTIKRFAAVLAATAVTVTTFGLLSAPAQAMAPQYYACKIDGKWMFCQDAPR